jgi:FG-GAP-like repeat
MTRKIAARFAIVVFMFLIAPSIMKAALFHKVLRGDISVRDPKLVDVNGDGKADLIGLGPEVWLSNGDGTFQPGQIFGSGGAGPASNAVADVNGDGQPDIIVFSACEAPGNCANSVIGVLLGTGDGTFQTAVTYNAGPGGGGRVAVADANGDGKADIVLVSGSHAGTLLGNGGGTFQPVQISDLGMGPLFMATADVNKDGRADLLLMDTNAWVSLANVDGTFQSALATRAGAVDPAGIAGVDANGDGNPDILFLDSCRNVYACYATGGMLVVQLGNGDGTFQARVATEQRDFFQLLWP